jgi:hypothetical protein
VVLIHSFDVLGVDLHFHKFSSPNSLYFSQNRQFFISFSVQIEELCVQNFLEKVRAGKSRPTVRLKPAHRPAKAGLEGPLRLHASLSTKSRSTTTSSILRSRTAAVPTQLAFQHASSTPRLLPKPSPSPCAVRAPAPAGPPAAPRPHLPAASPAPAPALLPPGATASPPPDAVQAPRQLHRPPNAHAPHSAPLPSCSVLHASRPLLHALPSASRPPARANHAASQRPSSPPRWPKPAHNAAHHTCSAAPPRLALAAAGCRAPLLRAPHRPEIPGQTPAKAGQHRPTNFFDTILSPFDTILLLLTSIRPL